MLTYFYCWLAINVRENTLDMQQVFFSSKIISIFGLRIYLFRASSQLEMGRINIASIFYWALNFLTNLWQRDSESLGGLDGGGHF